MVSIVLPRSRSRGSDRLNIVADVAPGSARESPYPRSVGVLGSGFLAVPLTIG